MYRAGGCVWGIDADRTRVVGWMRVTRGSSWSPGEIEWWLGSVKDGRDLAAVNGSVALVVDAENGVVGL